jgi:hypothetical protein
VQNDAFLSSIHIVGICDHFNEVFKLFSVRTFLNKTEKPSSPYPRAFLLN